MQTGSGGVQQTGGHCEVNEEKPKVFGTKLLLNPEPGSFSVYFAASFCSTFLLVSRRIKRSEQTFGAFNVGWFLISRGCESFVHPKTFPREPRRITVWCASF